MGGKDGGSSESRKKWEMVEMMDLAQPCLANSAHPAGFSFCARTHTHTQTWTYTSPGTSAHDPRLPCGL